MKKAFSILILIFTIISCNSTHSAKDIKDMQSMTKEETQKEFSKVAMSIKGMTCEKGCAKFIEKQMLSKFGDFLVNLEVNFERNMAFMGLDKKLNPKDIEMFIGHLKDGQYSAKVIRSN